jgi:hypothetical protein
MRAASEGREMEIALATVAGTLLLAPFRVSILSMVANLVIEATRFEATAQPMGDSRRTWEEWPQSKGLFARSACTICW